MAFVKYGDPSCSGRPVRPGKSKIVLGKILDAIGHLVFFAKKLSSSYLVMFPRAASMVGC